jgi:hypothetical protein
MVAKTITAGTLAQSVEQRTENPCVPGSIPGGTTKQVSSNFKKLQTPAKQGFLLYGDLQKFIQNLHLFHLCFTSWSNVSPVGLKKAKRKTHEK